MSDYIIDGTLLTNIADAVRSVDGISNTLTPAQMATRLNAVKSSIDSALSALTENGVEVPSGSTVHTLAELIAAIEAGGSAPGFAKVATGTITPSSNTALLQVSHELGQKPDISIVYNVSYNNPSSGVFSSIVRSDKQYFNVGRSGSTFYGHSGVADYVSDITVLAFPAKITASQTLYFTSSYTYRWIAGVFA